MLRVFPQAGCSQSGGDKKAQASSEGDTEVWWASSHYYSLGHAPSPTQSDSVQELEAEILPPGLNHLWFQEGPCNTSAQLPQQQKPRRTFPRVKTSIRVFFSCIQLCNGGLKGADRGRDLVHS